MRRPSLRANAEMQRLIGALDPAALPPLSGKMLRYLDDGVIERDGCVLLKALHADCGAFDVRLHRHRTGHECAVNRLSFAAAPAGPDRSLATALSFAGQLVEMLDRCGASGPFRVIVARQPEEGSFAVRFHRLRQGERWLDRDLETAYDAAVLVLDCGVRQTVG